jgi:hypothetical protein
MPFYKWIEEMPAGLRVETVKLNSYKSSKGYTDAMVIGDHIVGTKAEQEYYKYLHNGGESYSAYLVKKKVYDDFIAAEKAAERKIRDDKRAEEQAIGRKNAEVAKNEMIKSLILNGKEPYIESVTKHYKKEIEDRKKQRQTTGNKEEIGRLEMYIEQAKRQADDALDIATNLYYLDDSGNVHKKFDWKVGDAVLYRLNKDTSIPTKIEKIEDRDYGKLSYRVESAEGIYNTWIGYDGLFPVANSADNNLPENATKRIINGVEFTLVPIGDGSLHIERVFIPEGNRGKKLLSPAINILTQEADQTNTTLTAVVRPDDNKDESYEMLRNVFGKAGFKPDQFDGETYRNDLTRLPNKNEDLPSIENDVTLIKNQIEALTLAKEFADEQDQVIIDSQIEALTITLNFI